MGDWYIGEIRFFSFAFPPQGWMLCQGQLLQVSQYQILYALIGTRYGGTPNTSFNLPDLRGRAILGGGRSSQSGTTYAVGVAGGLENVPLSVVNIPSHNHTMIAAQDTPTANTPLGAYFTEGASTPQYTPSGQLNTLLQPGSIGQQGGSEGHNNMQPSLVLNACIATQGTWPSRQ